LVSIVASRIESDSEVNSDDGISITQVPKDDSSIVVFYLMDVVD